MNINILNFGSVNIKIYDTKKRLLIDKNINKKTFFDVNKGVYIIKLFYNCNYIGSYVLLHKNDIDCFNICPILNYNNKKIFYLYDYFYKGLKIQRGELILGT